MEYTRQSWKEDPTPLKIHEETRKTVTDKKKDKDPVATLLDITKAYPRVNRLALWRILAKVGMGPKMRRTLEGIHEKTEFRVEFWIPVRRLREGCATSPTLFNIYHAKVMKRTAQEREIHADAKKKSGFLGCSAWGTPCHRGTRRKQEQADKTELRIAESLFADDTMVCGLREEIQEGKEKIKEVMGWFEEKCQPANEEHLDFGRKEAEGIRMLGTYIGRKKDVDMRINRRMNACFLVRKRIKGAKLTKRTSKDRGSMCRVNGAFRRTDSTEFQNEINRIQRNVDRIYRYIWSDKKEPPLKEMAKNNVNIFEVRSQLAVDRIETKITRRALQRVGHVLRMDKKRPAKKVIIGWPAKERDQEMGHESKPGWTTGEN